MKKYMFLLAFLAGFSFVSQAYSQNYPSVTINDETGVDDGGDDSRVPVILPTDPMPDPEDEDIPIAVIEDDDVPLADDNSSASGVTKNRAFTPAEAADATKDNGKNSVTINF